MTHFAPSKEDVGQNTRSSRWTLRYNECLRVTTDGWTEEQTGQEDFKLHPFIVILPIEEPRKNSGWVIRRKKMNILFFEYPPPTRTWNRFVSQINESQILMALKKSPGSKKKIAPSRGGG